MKINKTLFFSLLLITSHLHAKPITLENEKEIHRANQLNLAMDAVSTRVMTCIQDSHESKASCTCPDMDSCKFKSEFRKAALLYCKLKSDFPEWTSRGIIYSTKGSKITHAFSMEALERLYGKHCE